MGSCADLDLDLIPGMDPFTLFLHKFFNSLLSMDGMGDFWNNVKTKVKEEGEVRTEIINFLVKDYNSRLALKTGHFDLYKQRGKFPPILVEHYYTKESLGWFWRKLIIKKWPELKDISSPPDIVINEKIAMEILPDLELETGLSIKEVVKKPKWRVAAYQLNPKLVLDSSIKYLLNTLYDGENRILGDIGNSNWKVEAAMKLTPTTGDTGENLTDSRLLLIKCVFKLCRILGYQVLDKGEDYHFLQIPDDVQFDVENVLLSFTSINSDKPESEPESVLIELNSKDFYSQYSETVLILYNYARIRSILDKYKGLVDAKEYPELPGLNEVDFNLIGECKDEFPIILMLFLWPRVRKSLINVHRRGKSYDKVNLVFLFDFVKSLARASDTFYNRNIVIVPRNAPHNFPAMFARLYLIQSVSLIFKEFIYFSGIQMDGVY